MTTQYAFGLYDDDLIGAAVYALPATPNVYNCYSEGEKLLELRRLCCIDDTPRNTESYFIARTLKWLKKNTDVKRILAYADPAYGHQGTIYKASNFEFIGKSQASRKILYQGRLIHGIAIRKNSKREIDAYSQEIMDALESGEAKYVKGIPKNIYLYRVWKTQKNRTCDKSG